MRKIRIILVLLAVSLCFVSCDYNVDRIFSVSAHRGIHTKASEENTLNSYVEAVRLGVEWAELDIWCTSDGELVLTHDKNLNRCFSVDVDVTTHTLSELRNTYGLTSTQLPTLEAVLDEVAGNIKLQIEVKDINTVSKLVELFNAYSLVDDCVVISFDSEALKQVKDSNSNICCGYLASSYSSKMLTYEWADFLDLQYGCVNRKVVLEAQLANKDVWAWTVDKKVDFDNMKRCGVRGIVTNNVEFLTSSAL